MTKEKDINCSNCSKFDSRTNFCRCNPPVPLVINVTDKFGNIQNKYVTKYPYISKPELDYCSKIDIIK